MKAYLAKSGVKQYKPSLKQVMSASALSEGFCVGCGKRAEGVEPDARRYVCRYCNKPKVYGAEELVLMGLVH